MSFRYISASVILSGLAIAALVVLPGENALASGPPSAATSFITAYIGPAGGSFSGFGITVTFAPGAVAHQDLVILGNWPNGLDVPPPSGRAVKTFSLQVCNDSTGTPVDCTSEFGNNPYSPAGTERVAGKLLAFTGYQGPSVNFGSATNKLVTFTIDTGGNSVYIYNANFSNTNQAYPKPLPSTSGNGVLTFKTFEPIVWTVTSP